MNIGRFSVSLAVKDLPTSRAFYEAFGFEQVAGEPEKNWIVLQNGEARIGLFQGMFEGNLLTFNPGWDSNAKTLDVFDDVRKIQAHLKQNAIALTQEADEKTDGPASIVMNDPDGNVILMDQHV